MHYDLPASRGNLSSGRVSLLRGVEDPYRYVLVASPIRMDGRVIGRDRKAGLTLYELGSRARP